MPHSKPFDYAPAAGFAPPVALFARSPAAAARALGSLGATVPLDPDRPRPPAWVELDGSPDAIEEQLIARLDRQAREEGLCAVIAAPHDALDPLSALVSSPGIEILIAPDALERAGAAAMLAAFAARPARAQEAARGPDLRALSEEVSRIAEALAQLSAGEGDSQRLHERMAEVAPPPGAAIDVARVRAAIRERRLRAQYFEPSLFADPAWDMLLDLFSAALQGKRVPVSSLCAAAEVPPTTALRWIRGMTAQGLFERRPDRTDARRVFVGLSASADAAMTRYFAAL